LHRALPETFLPPLAPNTWVLVWDGHGGFMRTNEASGLALDSGDAQHAPLALKLSLQAAHPEKIELRFPANGNEPELPEWGELPVAIQIGEPWDWRKVAIPKHALNLLWGKFAPPIRLMEWLPGLRVPLLILCAALMLEAVATNIEWLRLASERHSLMQQMERDFRVPFGEESAIADPVIQMQRNLATLHHAAGLPDESDFLPLLEGSIGAFTEFPGRRVRAIHYETGRLDLDVHLCSTNKLDLLQKHLKRHGFSVRAGGVQKTTDGIDVRLTLQYGGGL
jgi:type II secretion system protein L